MDCFEYKVVPAPVKGSRVRGLRRAEDKFALSIQDVMNEMASTGWEFQRSETLPHEERSGITGTTTTFRSVLVFRRPKDVASSDVVLKAEAFTQPEASDDNYQIQKQPIEPAPKSLARVPEKQVPSPILSSYEDEFCFVDQARPTQVPEFANIPVALRARAAQKQTRRKFAAE